MFANPVSGRIVWKKSPRAPGQFMVTRSCQDHRNAGQGCALDLWNGGKPGSRTYAMRGGTVTHRDDTQGILHITHGGGWRSDLAHQRGIRVGIGQVVRTGQWLGYVSDAHDPSVTNFDAIHLHVAAARLIAGHWVEVDLWPLLNQNIREADVIHTVDRVLYLDASGKPAPRLVNLKAGRYTGYSVLGSKKTASVGNTSCHARSICSITHLPDADPHGPGWLEITDGIWKGYYLRTGPLDPGVNPT